MRIVEYKSGAMSLGVTVVTENEKKSTKFLTLDVDETKTFVEKYGLKARENSGDGRVVRSYNLPFVVVVDKTEEKTVEAYTEPLKDVNGNTIIAGRKYKKTLPSAYKLVKVEGTDGMVDEDADDDVIDEGDGE